MGLFDLPEPKAYEVVGKKLVCQVCGHDAFWKREAQLNTAISEFFNIAWSNESAMCFVCDQCGYIHWFVRK